MPTAFTHDPNMGVPSSTTNTAVVRWSGTTGGTLLSSGITIDNSNVMAGITSLTVDNLNLNGNTISSTAGTDLLITPLSGQQIVLDGTIIIDAGVVTGATSITSTEFYGGGGNLTGISAGTALTGSTNNTITTVTGANAIVGEANLTFDGTNLTVGTGNVVIGTAGKGIDFSAQTASTSGTVPSGGEVLDHYEEGTFTPHLFDDDRDVSTATYGYRPANYTRIGNRVWFTISWEWTSMGNLTTGDNVKIGGLPFTSSSNPTVNIRHACSIGMIGSLSIGVSNAAWFQVRVDGNRSDADVTYTTYGGTSFNQQYIKLSDLSSSGVLDISGSYEVA